MSDPNAAVSAQPSVLSKPIIVGVCCALVFLLATNGPFLLFGSNWGMFWFALNLPVAAIVEALIGISAESRGTIAAVAILNGAILGLAGWYVAKLMTVKVHQ